MKERTARVGAVRVLPRTRHRLRRAGGASDETCADRVAAVSKSALLKIGMLALLNVAAHVDSNIAIVGNSFNGPPPIARLKQRLSTPWTLIDASNATHSEIASASAFLEAPVQLLKWSSASAKLYQFSFTGVPDFMLPSIPPQLAVANCHQSSIPIAEYALAHILSWTVGIQSMDAELRHCTWKTSAPGNTCAKAHRQPHRQVSNLTIGILGYGHIGEAIATRAVAFGSRVIATTLNPPLKPPAPLAWLGDDSHNPRLFAESDFLIVCTPLLNSTRGLVGYNLLRRMAPSAVLINIARGPIVDEGALYNALKSKAIGGAVLDVWWNSLFKLPEGGVGPSAWPSRLRFDELPNVLMSPHSSGSTPEAEEESIKEMATNLDNLAQGKPLINILRNASRTLPRDAASR